HDEAEQQSESADQEPAHQQRPPIDASEIHRRQVGQYQAGLSAAPPDLLARRGLLDGLREQRPRTCERTQQQDQHDGTHKASLHTLGHLPSHKNADYNFSRGGNAMPPVRKILMPSSTVMSGKIARSRS